MLKFSFKFFMGCVICLYGISHSITRPPVPTITSASYADGKITINGNMDSAEQCHAVLLTDLSASLINAYESGSSLEGAALSYAADNFPIGVPLENQTIERYFVAVAASKIDSNGVRIFSGWRVYTDTSGLPISISTSQADKKETVFYRARKISERNDSLVVIDFKFSLPTSSASAFSFTLKRDATPIVAFSDLSNITDTVNNITSALTNSSRINSNTLVIIREANGFYLYNIYTILSDYGKNANDRLSGQIIKTTGEVDTAIAHIGIYGDIPHQNMISTVYDLLRVEGTVPNPIYPGTLQTIASADTLKAKLLITAMLDISLPHNSPAPNSNEAAGGIFTNYIQCMDNIVRNWTTIRSGGTGLPRLRNIHANILETNKDSIIIDPIYVKNNGTLAEYGQQKESQKRKNYAFYEGYSRLNVDLEVRPSGSPAVPTASGLLFRISPNIQLYQANLADTFNMFDTAFISGGPLSRRIIIPSNDSLLLKFQTDGIWLKGDSANSSEKNYYCGMEAVRLKMQSGVDSIGVPFAATNEKDVLGDAAGSIVGDVEKSILMVSNVFFDGKREDTLKATNNVRTTFKGNKRKIEYEGKYKQAKSIINFYVSSDSVNGPCRVIERGNKHIVIENISTYNISTVVACETVQGKINRVFKADLSSSNLLFKDIYNGYEQSENTGADPIALALEKDPDAWIPIEKRNNAFIVLTWSQGIKVYSCRNDTNCLVLPRNKLEEVNCFALFDNWATFEAELLGLATDSLYLYMPNFKDGFFKANYGDKRYMNPDDLKMFKLAKLDPANAKSHQTVISVDPTKIEMTMNEKGRSFNNVLKDRVDNKGTRNGYDGKNYLMLFHSPGNENSIELELKAPTSVPKFNYQIFNSINGDPSGPIKEIVVGGGTFLESYTIKNGKEHDFEIHFGVDCNRDGKLGKNEIDSWNGAIYKVYGVTESEYNSAHSNLNFATLAVSKITYQLMRRFLFGTYNSTRYPEFIPIENGALKRIELGVGSSTHRFGAPLHRVYTINGKDYADLPIVEYQVNSAGSNFFAMHKKVEPAAMVLYNSITFGEVNSNYVADGNLIQLQNKKIPSTQWGIFKYALGNTALDGDIFFKAYKISSNLYRINEFSIRMGTGDVWDFDYFNKKTAANIPGGIIKFPEEAATVQCGNGVCGNSVGEVVFVLLTFERSFGFGARYVSP